MQGDQCIVSFSNKPTVDFFNFNCLRWLSPVFHFVMPLSHNSHTSEIKYYLAQAMSSDSNLGSQ